MARNKYQEDFWGGMATGLAGSLGQAMNDRRRRQALTEQRTFDTKLAATTRKGQFEDRRALMREEQGLMGERERKRGVDFPVEKQRQLWDPDAQPEGQRPPMWIKLEQELNQKLSLEQYKALMRMIVQQPKGRPRKNVDLPTPAMPPGPLAAGAEAVPEQPATTGGGKRRRRRGKRGGAGPTDGGPAAPTGKTKVDPAHHRARAKAALSDSVRASTAHTRASGGDKTSGIRPNAKRNRPAPGGYDEYRNRVKKDSRK